MVSTRKRKARDGESSIERGVRRNRNRLAQAKRRIVHNDDTSEGVQGVSTRARMARVAETGERNTLNQHKILLAKADAKQSRCRDRANRYARQQDQDRAAFFAAIDEPMGLICGSCGEIGNPRRMAVLQIDKTNAFFDILATPSNPISPDGLIREAVVAHRRARSVPFCESCQASLKRRKTPKFCAASGFVLASIPQELAVLNAIESRLIGLGICFTTCYNLVGDGQECTKGNAINFWNDAYSTVSSLPRPLKECGVVRLKSRGDSDSSRVFEVRPNLVKNALLWLYQNNPLYKDIVVSEEALRDLDETRRLLELPTLEMEQTEHTNAPTACCETDIDQVPSTEELFHMEFQDWSKQTESETILDQLCVEVDGPTSTINEYTTKTMMQCCFPTLFPDGMGGLFPIDSEVRMYTYDMAEYFAHLIAWHDRRFVMHRNFKFFCLNIMQRRQIDGLTKRIGQRKPDSEDIEHQSKDVRVKKVLKELKPYFKAVRGSGLYWSGVRDDVMSLIGNEILPSPYPTFFFTLSAADTIWPDFFCACNPKLTLTTAAQLPPAERRRYLNENPDIASKHFYRSFRAFFGHIMCGPAQPLGEITDFFWRVECQKRGSPHVRGLLWVKDGPDVLELSRTEEGRNKLSQFVDRFISADKGSSYAAPDCACSVCVNLRSNADQDIRALRPAIPANDNDTHNQCDLAHVVNRVQQHACFESSRCRKKNGLCRFEFPKCLRDSTDIAVEQAPNGAIRVKVECRRTDAFTNNFNPDLLAVWRANMDIKLIGNAYGAAEYTAAYVSKSEPDTTRFKDMIERALQKCPEETEHHAVLRRVANATLAAREVSAQEALWILQKGLPMYGKSRGVLKVKTSPHEKRFYKVDSESCREEIETGLDANSCVNSVRVEAIEAAYMARPDSFSDMNFRHFVEHYEASKDNPSAAHALQRWPRLDGDGFIKARRVPQAIISTPRAPVDPMNPDYCYAQVFLMVPWRCLEHLPNTDENKIKQYQLFRESSAEASNRLCVATERASQLQLLSESRNENILSLPVPDWTMGRENHETFLPAQTELMDTPDRTLPPSTYTVADVRKAETFISGVVKPFMLQRKHAELENGGQSLRARKQYLYPISLAESNMNADQWNAFALCMQQSRLRRRSQHQSLPCEPMRMVLNGEGGCGKSWLINHVVKDIHHVFQDSHIKTRNSRRVLLVAHHGTAAFNIKGSTICSAFSLPGMSGRGYEKAYEPLAQSKSGMAKLKTLQDKYASIHMIILDEYSVVSCAMLYWLDQRMREIWPSCRDIPFGGRDLILAGDLGQLSPVSPAALFTPLDKLANYNQRQGRILWENIHCVCNLTSQNRGLLDPQWYAALTRLRKMEETTEDVNLFNTRHGARIPTSLTTKFIAYKNEDVDRANEQSLSRHDQPVFEIQALHEVESVRECSRTGESLQTARSQLFENAILPNRDRDKVVRPSIRLAIGAPVSLTKNVEQSAGLCNGTRARVHDFMMKPGSSIPIVLVEIMDKYIGPSFLNDKPNIVPIVPDCVTWTNRTLGLRTRRTGVPLRLGYAMTIHKVQGLTCSTLIFDPTGIPSSAFAYVGLSRVRHRDNLSLLRRLEFKRGTTQSTTKTHLQAEWNRLDGLHSAQSTHNTSIVGRYQHLAECENRNEVDVMGT